MKKNRGLRLERALVSVLPDASAELVPRVVVVDAVRHVQRVTAELLDSRPDGEGFDGAEFPGGVGVAACGQHLPFRADSVGKLFLETPPEGVSQDDRGVLVARLLLEAFSDAVDAVERAGNHPRTVEVSGSFDAHGWTPESSARSASGFTS